MKKKTQIGMIIIVLILAIALMASGCTQSQSQSEQKQQESSEQQEPSEQQKAPEDEGKDSDEQNITEIAPVDKMSTENLTLLSSVGADFDNDGTEEDIELYTSAQKDSSGEIMWDDGQKWLLLVRKADRDFVLYDDYIQLGSLDFWLYTDENEDGEYHISIVQPASAGLFFSDYTYDTGKNVFIKKAIYEAGNINLMYSSRY